MVRAVSMHESLRHALALAKTASHPLAASLRGDLYEELSLYALKAKLSDLGLSSLHRTGKSGDRGVDLVGNWKSMDLLVQCKSTQKKITGSMWRDLSGVSTQHTRGSEVPAIVGLVSPMPMTSAGLVEFMSADHAFVHFLMPWTPSWVKSPGVLPIKSSLLNLAAEELLTTLEVTYTDL